MFISTDIYFEDLKEMYMFISTDFFYFFYCYNYTPNQNANLRTPLTPRTPNY